MRRPCLSLILLLCAAGGLSAQDEMADLKFLVVKDNNGKPIRNASVVMHPVDKSGKQSRGGLQIKTDPEGRASYEGVPYGKLRIQVLAQGFQTFGDDYEINRPNMDITIKMKRPSEQFSIYQDHPGDKKEEKDPPGKESKPQ
jgi:Carboxypeptidase regulatory-like domain